MKIFLYISDLIIPLTIFLIILYALFKKINLYDSFVEGVEDGFKTVFSIAPAVLGLILAVGILRDSGTLDIFSNILSPLAKLIKYPVEAIPLTFMRLISSSASTGLLVDIFKIHGPDSFLGRFVSVMMSCTETIFYTLSVYFMVIKITKTRYILPVALISNFIGVIFSLYITKLIF